MDTGDVEIFQKLYFKDIGKKDGTVLLDEDGNPFSDEEINAPWFPKFVTDLWYGATGGKKPTGKKPSANKKQNSVNKYIFKDGA
jgi:hypothetical protein